VYTVEDIRRHVRDLKPVLQANASLITSWEAGFLGAWGEWGPSKTNIQYEATKVNELMTSIAADAPAGVPVIMRYPWHREMVAPAVRAKIGFYNDHFEQADAADQYDPARTSYWNGR
jgi:Domain of unknown function (DUF4874)